MKFTAKKDYLGFFEHGPYEIFVSNEAVLVCIDTGTALRGKIVLASYTTFNQAPSEYQRLIKELSEAGVIKGSTLCPTCDTLHDGDHKCPYDNNKCVICKTKIFTGELCAKCAEGNDPFDLDPDNHEYPTRTEL